MTLRLSALSLAFIAAAAAAGPVPKVVNGAAAPLTDYPWMFHLVSGDPARPSLNDHYCGGAYLGDGIAVERQQGGPAPQPCGRQRRLDACVAGAHDHDVEAVAVE